ncbi:MAG: hypothetical protein AAF985_19530, partial [Bacteroidota bacterium]
SFFHSCLKNLGIAQMATAQYSSAEQNFLKAQTYAPRHSLNDYIVRYYRTLNAFHSGNYTLAQELYLKNKNCKFTAIKDQFAIMQAYLCFLTYTGYLPFNGPFRIGKYLNETFKQQTHKQGDNINILIAELLIYLARNRGRFIDRVEAVKNYSYRHLKGKATQRAKWLIRILCMLPRVDFNVIALQKAAQKQIEQLRNNPLAMGGNFALEIIPYEALLAMIFKHLEQKVA